MESISCSPIRKYGIVMHIMEDNVMSSALKKTLYTGLVAAFCTLPLKESFAQAGASAGNGNRAKIEQVDNGTTHKSVLAKALMYSETRKGVGIAIAKGQDNAEIPDEKIIAMIKDRFAKDTVKCEVFLLHGTNKQTGHVVYVDGEVVLFQGEDVLLLDEFRQVIPQAIQKYKLIADKPKNTYTMQ